MCEDNVGYGGTFDPKYAIASDGAIFAATYDGLEISRDGGCSFSVATSDLAPGDPAKFSDIWVDALDIGPTGEVWAGTAENGVSNNFFSSRDGGHTFTPTGLASSEIWWKSAKVAPSDSSASTSPATRSRARSPTAARCSRRAHLLRSDDGGAHVAGVRARRRGVRDRRRSCWSSAVDPTNRDTVFVTSLGAGPQLGDRLYLSTDGGATLTEVLVDRRHDPRRRDPRRRRTCMVATTAWTARTCPTDGGQTFTQGRPGTPQLACLGQRSDGLFGCGANWVPDYKAVAASADGDSWNKVFRFVQLAGPLNCPAGTKEHDMLLRRQWGGDGGLQQQFGATAARRARLACGRPADAPARRRDRAAAAAMQAAQPAACCCDAGPGAPASVLFGLGLGALLAAAAPATSRR